MQIERAHVGNSPSKFARASILSRLTETGQGYFQNLAIADYRKLGVTEEFTLGEVLISSGNVCSQPLKVPLQCFGKIPAALCGGFPAKPPSTLARFLQVIFCDWRVYRRRVFHFFLASIGL